MNALKKHWLCLRSGKGSPGSSLWTIHLRRILVLLAAGMACFVGSSPLQAQEEGAIQLLTGRLDTGEIVYYLLPGMEQNQVLTVHLEGTSGNLDPFVGLADQSLNRERLRQDFRNRLEQEIQSGRDPVEIIEEVADSIFLAWNDDFGSGTAAAFEFVIPVDGDYQLVLTGSPLIQSFGDYEMVIGLDAPQVLSGDVTSTGETIALLDDRDPSMPASVDLITGTLGPSEQETIFTLRDLEEGETVYANIQATTGALKPILTLESYSNKPIITDNFNGQSTEAQIEYVIPNNATNVKLRVTACCQNETISEGDYRLMVGINDPDVLVGTAQVTEQLAVVSPALIEIGVKLDQITGVDQVSENFGAVFDLRMAWTDPNLAFDPDECQCFFRTFQMSGFIKYLEEKGITEWPVTTLYNLQGRLDSQGETIVVTSSGRALLNKRMSATLQAPDFNFRRFPFDEQKFYIRLASVFPDQYFRYTELEGFSRIGEQLGEEEWIIRDLETTIDAFEGSSRFNFGFTAERQVDYYVFRVFLPLIIIITISWVIFFMKNYERRVDAAAGNLLLLIAFNFTISGNLPRLAYLTLMDAILVTAFIVTGLVLVLNVYLKRLEVQGQRERAERLDKFVIWFYPLLYIIIIGGVIIVFPSEV